MSELVINDVPATCIIQAAHHYYLPVSLVISILKAENGRVGEANPNKNGTYDYGPMQINSIWLKRIAPYGYTAYDLEFNPCANIEIGTWILAQAVADGKNFWSSVGNYHSHTDGENRRYGSRVSHYYYFLEQALSSPRF